MKTWALSFFSLLFPRYCVVCDTPLGRGEEHLCLRCNIDMPRTNLHLIPDNRLERLFWGRFPIHRATSLLYYAKGSAYSNMLYSLKYKGQKDIGRLMGRYLAEEAASTGFFEDIDMIIPVPLHRKKEKARGYNQSEYISKGIADVTHIKVVNDAIIRHRHTETQARQGMLNRSDNVIGAFTLVDKESLTGKHILLVDDVITTGATICACADALQQAGDVKISVISLAVVPL